MRLNQRLDYLKAILLLIAIFAFTHCAPSARFSSELSVPQNTNSKKVTDNDVIYGESSYYADKFHGRKTANGEIFDMYKKTAAHKSLPFNTMLEVTNLENNKSVIVRVNDRGPFVGDRILDLSYGAAREIDMLSSGVVEVRIKILKWGG
jgi:rare lipoprotein A